MDRPYLRLMASVLLRREGKLLMMHRGAHKKVAPNQWAFPGGHVEPEEMNNPRIAALRELFEETGVREEQLAAFDLRYTVMSTSGRELRVYIDFVGDIAEDPVLPECDEGTLHWLTPEEIMDKPMPVTMRALMEHYIQNPDDSRIHLGIVTQEPFFVTWTHEPLSAIVP